MPDHAHIVCSVLSVEKIRLSDGLERFQIPLPPGLDGFHGLQVFQSLPHAAVSDDQIYGSFFELILIGRRFPLEAFRMLADYGLKQPQAGSIGLVPMGIDEMNLKSVTTRPLPFVGCRFEDGRSQNRSGHVSASHG